MNPFAWLWENTIMPVWWWLAYAFTAIWELVTTSAAYPAVTLVAAGTLAAIVVSIRRRRRGGTK